MRINPNNKEERRYLKTKIKERYSSIVYLIDNLQLKDKDSKKFTKKAIQYLKEEINKKESNNFGEKYVGFYSGNALDANVLRRYTFEIAFGINSTLAKIKTLLKLNELSCWEKFLRQLSFSNVFGFTVSDVNLFKNLYCSPLSLSKTYSIENKFHLVKYLKLKIDEGVKELLPLLILRFNGEELIRKKQQKGFDWSINVNEKEEEEYKKLLLYSYYLGCLKIPSFNPDNVFRVKLVCPIHHKRLNKFKYFDICPCVYAIDEDSISLLMNNRIIRRDKVEIEKKKWFEQLENSEMLRLRYERKGEINDILSRISFDEQFWRDIELSWGMKKFQIGEGKNG